MAKEQPAEKPVVESQKAEVTPNPEEDAKAILAELEKYGINNTEKLQNMAHASSQVGGMANKLGEANQRISQLEQLLREMQNKPQETYNEYGEPKSLTRDDIRQEMKRFYMEDIIKPQQEIQSRIFGELSEIQNDPDFTLVSEMWEKHWGSPSVQQRVFNGQSSPKHEYERLMRTFLKESLSRTHGALKGLMDRGAKAPPPHMESGEQQHVETHTSDEEFREKKKKLKENWKGEDDDIMKMVKAFLPDGDPLLG